MRYHARIATIMAQLVLAIVAGAFSTGAGAQHAPTVREAPCAGPTPQVWITRSLAAGGTSSGTALPECRSSGPVDATITVEPTQRRQRMLGFGAALTGSATWLLQSQLDSSARAALLQQLFAPPPQGIGLSLLRLPIGSTDLSRTRYSLAPNAPPPGKPVALDLSPMQADTLPVLQSIVAINPEIRIMTLPWSAPAWMKANHSLVGGRLLPGEQQRFADYLFRFLQQMADLGIPIYSVSLQNEPNVDPRDYPGMLMSADESAHIIGRYLGPMLARAHLGVRIFALDDNWMWVHQVAELLDDGIAAKYVKGVAWHCYGGQVSSQEIIHRQYPALVQVLSECADGDWAPNDEETIAGLVREEFIAPLRHWDSGVVLWALALDSDGGPHDGGCGICTPVVTIPGPGKAVEFTRDYYALAHFSQFVPPGSWRVASNDPGGGLTDVAFDTGDGGIAVVLVNQNAAGKRLQITAGSWRTVVTVPPQSVTTAAFSRTSPKALKPARELAQAPPRLRTRRSGTRDPAHTKAAPARTP